LDFFKQDVAAGFVVFLVALPLCLGISLASEVPLLSGIVTGIVAGLVVSLLSGSELSVSGPAAGLTMTVIAGQHATGSLQAFFLAVALSGVLQIVMGFLRAGTLAALFPTSVIKGMLAAIGIIIIMKQIPHALGWKATFEVEESLFLTAHESDALSAILSVPHRLSMGAVIVSLFSVFVLIGWEKFAKRGSRFFRLLPGPLVVVIAGVVLNELFRYLRPDIALTAAAGQLVALPPISGVQDLFTALPKPALSALSNHQVWITACVIALIGSIETLLCLEATDKLDPLKRVSLPNRELIAQGCGNIIAGSLGGLPMTSVIVRSSANIYSGGRTRISPFVHGLMLMICVVSIPTVLNMIPLAALASILILIGYKLADARLFKGMFRNGLDQFIPFLVTVVAVVFSDLLTGVCIGTVVGLIFVMKMNYHSAFSLVNEGEYHLLRFAKDMTFIQKVKLKSALAQIPEGSSVLIDGGNAVFVDFDIVEVLKDFKASADDRHIAVSFRNFRNPEKRFLGVENVEVV
jgi:MFS superfamily sulfate permease-like transporter